MMVVVMAVVVIVLGPFVQAQVTPLTACVIWQVMFGSGFRIGTMIVTMVPQLMV